MTEEDISFSSGQSTLNGFLVIPDAPGQRPGVIVIHEAYGLNNHIRDVTRRFAGEGYAALAVDLFTGRNRALCMARYMITNLGSREPFGVSDLKAALDHLAGMPRVDPKRIGAIGFCLGGGYAVTWARGDDRLRAIAPFYAFNPRPLESIRRMCPVVGSYPEKDFTARSGRRLEARLTDLEVPHDFKVYPGARHSFFNDQGPAYDPTAAKDAWQRTLAFFADHLAAS